MLDNRPSWVYPGAKIDLDFANSRYWGGSVALCSASSNSGVIQSVVNGPSNSLTGSYAPDINGILIPCGSLIPRITRGRGLWSEGPYTNYALWCRDHTNAAWTKTNMTAAKDQTGADNVANAASSLTASASPGTSLQAITQASTTFVGSAYIKRITGSGTVKITVDNGVTYTDVTSLINSSTYTLVMCPVQTLANPTFGVQLGTSGDKIAIDFCQCENSPYKATTPLLTTTASLARGVEEPAINDPGLSHPGNATWLTRLIFCRGGPFSFLLVGSGNGRGAATSGGITSDDNLAAKGFCGGAGTGAVASFTNANSSVATTANTGNTDLYNINRTACRANGQKASVCLNGGAIATVTNNSVISASTALSTFTHIGLGNIGAGTTSINGVISRIPFWDRELSDSEMIEFTQPNSAYGANA